MRKYKYNFAKLQLIKKRSTNLLKINSAFTLAEIMIVLAIVGILTAILLPIAISSGPNEKLAKLQGIHPTLLKVLRDLAGTGEYFSINDLGKDKHGNTITDSKAFCNALADVLTTKSVNCSDDDLGYNATAVMNLPSFGVAQTKDGKNIYDYVDCMCSKFTTSGSEIITANGVTIYTINPHWHFGSKVQGTTQRIFDPCAMEQRYKYVCVDVDGINEGEEPFGYALKQDGKVVVGKKAQLWIEKGAKTNVEDIEYTPFTQCDKDTLNLDTTTSICNLAVAPSPSPSPTPTPEPSPEPEPSEPEAPAGDLESKTDAQICEEMFGSALDCSGGVWSITNNGVCTCSNPQYYCTEATNDCRYPFEPTLPESMLGACNCLYLGYSLENCSGTSTQTSSVYQHHGVTGIACSKMNGTCVGEFDSYKSAAIVECTYVPYY